MLNNVVGYWAYIWLTFIWGAYIRVRLYSGGGGAYIWNEVSVSICGGLIFGGGGGLIVGGLRYIAPMCVAMIWVGFDGVHSLLDISAAFVSIFLTWVTQQQ
jgi:hypothetical protein